jgi:hypothetical protein
MIPRESEAARDLRQGAPIAERYAMIDAETANYPVAWMYRLLGVPRS